MKRHLHLKAAAASCVLVLAAAGGARAQIIKPTYIGNDKAPMTNQLGRNVPGTINNPDGTAVWVEIREVGTSIRPPDPATGEGNEAFNPLMRASYMGHDVSVGQNTGTFSESLTTNRLKDGSNYYARVYDKGTPAASLYYANSVQFQDVPPEKRNQEAVIDVVFQGWHRIDGEADVDSDGDRIPDLMETEDLGTSPSQKDTDGDGYNDYFEVMHNEFVSPTEPNIPLDVLLSEVAPGERGVSWGANPGLDYRLEVRPRWVDEEAYIELWSGTAAETNLQHNVESWLTTNSPKGFFRVVVP